MIPVSLGANADLAALAHKVYLQAAWEDSFIGMLIAWAIITKLEG